MEAKPKLGIVGVGWVGAQVKKYFEEFKKYESGKDLLLYDIDESKCAGDINDADIVFITVPTPRSKKDGSCDISILEEAMKVLKGDKIVVIKSTVPPGTTEYFQKKYPDFKLLFNPEFLSERTAWQDMLRPDRQIVGFTDKSFEVAHLVLSLLPKAPFMSPWGTNTYTHTRISATEAEFIKYASNVYFVRKINWANALHKAADKLGVDYKNIQSGMAADHRIGDSHLTISHGGYRGWGGYCFPKDLDAFIQFSKKEGLEEVSSMLEADRKFNEDLLKEQGLSLEGVSAHIDKLAEKLDNNHNK